jgi:DNA-binding response OmpR family regulator
LRESSKLLLNRVAYDARETSTAAEAAELIRTWEPHLVVVDMESGGLAILRQIGRSRETGGLRIPVLALTRRGDLRTRLAAFDQGVDDILTMPFAPEEFLARLHVIARRHLVGATGLIPVLKLGALTIDILSRQVTIGAIDVRLSVMELNLLYLLATNVGRLLTRGEIIQALWGTDIVVNNNVVDRHIKSLRAKLGDQGPQPRFIATVYGQGYRLLPSPDR